MIKKVAKYLSFVFAAAALDFGARMVFAPRSPLLPDQKQACEEFYQSTFNCASVRVTRWRVSTLAPSSKLMVVGNTVFGADSVMLKQEAVHEAMHVLQNQKNLSGSGLTGAFALWLKYEGDYSKAYHYTARPGSHFFRDYNIEQQAQMAEQYVAAGLNKFCPETQEQAALKDVVERAFPHLKKPNCGAKPKDERGRVLKGILMELIKKQKKLEQCLQFPARRTDPSHVAHGPRKPSDQVNGCGF